MEIAIVGAGLAGLACAARLGLAGHAVTLFDKGRAAGGRMSSRRVQTELGEAGFDHGAQYFTVRDEGFRAQVEAWARDGLVARWAAPGPDCWVGTPAMNAPLKQLASTARVRWNTRVDRLAGSPGHWTVPGEGEFEVVILAVPSENAAPLLTDLAPLLAARAVATPAQPCWTLMAAFPSRLKIEADLLREDGPIAWAARNSAKPGRTGPEAWVVQAGAAWSQAHLEEIAPALLNALSGRIGAPLPPVLTASVHRWRYARSGNAGDGMIWHPGLKLGLCGDWLLGPRIECAWVSGDRLAQAIHG
jgi:predicted NAD/FAD-dependent oxidoreductase